MRNLAKRQSHDPEIAETLGTIVEVAGSDFVIETETRRMRARRAKSCLLEPVLGDEVIVAVVDSDQRAYVLAVLERDDAGAPASIVAEGDLSIKVTGGALDVVATAGVHLVSPKEVSVVTGAVQVNAVDGSVALDRLSFLGKFLRAEVGKAKIFGESLDSVLERISQRVKRSYRIIEESDHVRAEQIDYAAKKRVSLHGETALVTARHLAKIEGDQIHLG